MSDSSTPSTPTSEASTKVPCDASPLLGQQESSEYEVTAQTEERASGSATSRDILLFLIAFRILNALCVRTFFQPDEYFQSLEPAWQIAFGEDSGAWITWEWRHHLRSSIHPYIFAAVYWASSKLAQAIQLTPVNRAELLLVAPKVLQAIIAATGDYHTWKLAERVYGRGNTRAWAALALTVCSPWQWFCSARTLSNCLETTLTVIALQNWPWIWSTDLSETRVSTTLTASTQTQSDDGDNEEMVRSYHGAVIPDGKTEPELQLQRSLLLAALACILRPTNVLIWICLASFALFKTAKDERLVAARRPNMPFMISASWPSLRDNRKERIVLVKETMICGSLMLFISTLFDRSYFKQWTFPPFRFLYYNIVQSLAVFYGRNRWDYYLTEGYPLLLTTYIPFGLIGLYQAFKADRSHRELGFTTIRPQLATVAIIVPLILSLVSHKEVRFIYPLLPILHVLAASPITAFSQPALDRTHPSKSRSWTSYRPTLLPFVLLLNILIAVFTTQYHQPGPLAVMDYLRHEHEKHYLTQPPASVHINPAGTDMTVGFLMPCHSTPWRSHLVHSGIKAWALSCEPPVDLTPEERAGYLDEADQFYDHPEKFLQTTLGKPQQRKTKLGNKKPQGGLGADDSAAAWDGKAGKKIWPEYLVFFEGLEDMLGKVTKDSGYSECWRGWNSYFHDDWRRQGDIVVWCLRQRDGWKGGTGRKLLDEGQQRKGWFS